MYFVKVYLWCKMLVVLLTKEDHCTRPINTGGGVETTVLLTLTHYLIRLPHISSGCSSSSWITPSWTSAQSSCGSVIGIFTETGGQLHKSHIILCIVLLYTQNHRLTVVHLTLTGMLRLWSLSGGTGISLSRNGVRGILFSFHLHDINCSMLLFPLWRVIAPDILIPMKTCLHTAGGKEYTFITSRVAGLSDVCSCLWGMALIPGSPCIN